MQKKFEFKVSTGITSILMIFVVLSLTAFGILSYSSANADLNLSKKNAENITIYYAAEEALNEKLALLDSLLKEIQRIDGADFFDIAGERVVSEFGEGSYLPDSGQVVLEENISDRQKLVMTVKINAPGEDNRYLVENLKVIGEIGNYDFDIFE